MHTNSDEECQLVFHELLQDLLVPRAASEVAVSLMHIAVTESALGSGVPLDRILDELLKSHWCWLAPTIESSPGQSEVNSNRF